MSPPYDETGPRRDPLQTSPPLTTHRQNSIEYAVSTLGEILNLAFDDARRLDQYGRHVVSAFGELDHGQRVELGDQHPGLVEALLLLENQIQRMDQRVEWL